MIFEAKPYREYELRQVMDEVAKSPKHTDLYVDGKRMGAVIRIEDVGGKRYIHYETRELSA